MPAYPPKLFMLVMLCFVAVRSSAQTAQTDSAVLNQQLSNTNSFFNKAIGEQSLLFNGPEYQYYDPVIKGNAGYQDINTWRAGSVDYDGGSYTDVQMMYDIYADKLVVLLYNKFSPFSLVPDKVKDFTLYGHYFISMRDSLTDLSKGYYEQLYGGPSQVLIKWSKNIQTATTASNLDTYFLSSHSYYIKNGGHYYVVSGQGSLIDAFKDKKKQIKQYVKENGIRYKKDPEQAMIQVATYYDQISK